MIIFNLKIILNLDIVTFSHILEYANKFITIMNVFTKRQKSKYLQMYIFFTKLCIFDFFAAIFEKIIIIIFLKIIAFLNYFLHENKNVICNKISYFSVLCLLIHFQSICIVEKKENYIE